MLSICVLLQCALQCVMKTRADACLYGVAERCSALLQCGLQCELQCEFQCIKIWYVTHECVVAVRCCSALLQCVVAMRCCSELLQ